ncbi:MAG: PEGA domain-containing protein [Candidatus Nealsonbacteria bacterium]
MIKKTRTTIFFIFFFLFMIGGPSTILYSQGYRLNLNPEKGEKLITQTGGIFIKAAPRQADIYINGKLEEKTDFLFGSVLIENLLPGKYEVEVNKTGYQPWKKTLEIKEKEVTEGKSILLFPEEFNFNPLIEEIEDIWFTPEKNIIFKKATTSEWILKFYDSKEETELLRESDIYSKGAKLTNIIFSATSSDLILETEIAKKKRYFIFNPEETPLSLTEIESPNQIKEYTYNNYTFEKNGEILSVKSPNSESFEKIADSVKEIRISQDHKKLLYFTEHEISIFFLSDSIVPKKNEGETMILLRLSNSINDCWWIKSDHIIFSTDNNIKITEIDNRDILNIINIIKTKNPEILWNENEKKLYYLSENNLFISDTLLP